MQDRKQKNNSIHRNSKTRKQGQSYCRQLNPGRQASSSTLPYELSHTWYKGKRKRDMPPLGGGGKFRIGKPTSNRIQNNRLDWTYHVEWMEPEHILEQLMDYAPWGAKFIGCPKLNQCILQRNGTDRKVRNLMMIYGGIIDVRYNTLKHFTITLIYRDHINIILHILRLIAY
jgi:hypothetical protein